MPCRAMEEESGMLSSVIEESYFCLFSVSFSVTYSTLLNISDLQSVSETETENKDYINVLHI